MDNLGLYIHLNLSGIFSSKFLVPGSTTETEPFLMSGRSVLVFISQVFFTLGWKTLLSAASAVVWLRCRAKRRTTKHGNICVLGIF